MRRGARAIVVLVTLLLAFLMQRAVAHEEVVRAHRPLQTLPLGVGLWQGIPATFSPDVLGVLRPDDYLLRQYQAARAAPLTLYVAYYGHQRLNARIHSPSACLPAEGWLPVDVGYQEIAIPGSSSRLTANRYLIERGADRQVALYWFYGRGRVEANEVMATLYLAYDTLRRRGSDETLIRITSRVRGTPRDTLVHEIGFVQQVYPLLQKLLGGS